LLGVRVDGVDAFFALAQMVLSAFLSAQIALTRITFLEALILLRCIATDLVMETMHCEPTEDVAVFKQVVSKHHFALQECREIVSLKLLTCVAS